jgi:hypothetical protein
VEYKYRVNYAHINEDAEDIVGGVHHGQGTVEITTDKPVETQQQKDDVAKVVGRMLYEKHAVTEIAIQAIIPLETGHVVIDASDYGTDE